VAVVLFLVAGVLALLGRKDVQKASPPLPTETIASVQADITTVKQGISR
jgi:Putative Actinobacterial Holin-X, holin superfamily III